MCHLIILFLFMLIEIAFVLSLALNIYTAESRYTILREQDILFNDAESLRTNYNFVSFSLISSYRC